MSTEPFRQSFGSLLLKADPENQSLDFEEQFKDKHLCQQFDSLLNVTDPDEVVLLEKKMLIVPLDIETTSSAPQGPNITMPATWSKS